MNVGSVLIQSPKTFQLMELAKPAVTRMGAVSPIYDEEDAGQDIDYLTSQAEDLSELQSLRTSDIKLLSINYSEEDG